MSERSVEEQLSYALQLLDGKDVEPDYERAYSLLAGIAESGQIEASRALASMLHEGLGVTADVEKAVALYESLAERGDFLSCIELARIHAERDRSLGGPLEAAHWYRQALALPDAQNHPEAMREASAYRVYPTGRTVQDLAVCPNCASLFDPQYAGRFRPQPWYRLAKPYLKCPSCECELVYESGLSPSAQALDLWGRIAPLFICMVFFAGILNQAGFAARLAVIGLVSIPVLAGWWGSRKEAGRYLVSTADATQVVLPSPILFVKAVEVWVIQLAFEFVPLAMFEGLLLSEWVSDKRALLMLHNLCFALGAFAIVWCMLPSFGLLTRKRCVLIGLGLTGATMAFQVAAVWGRVGTNMPWGKLFDAERGMLLWSATIISLLVAPYLVAKWRKTLLDRG